MKASSKLLNESRCNRTNSDCNRSIKLLQFVQTLNDEDSIDLEIKLNQYLGAEAQCRTTFIMILYRHSEEAVIQVMGSEILSKIYRLPVRENLIDRLKDCEMLKNTPDLDQQLQIILNEIVQNHANDIVMIPVCQQKNTKARRLPITLLICYIDAQKSADHLIKITQETFNVCSTLLLNTYDAEEENRQKNQCQSLLSVARKLFSFLADVDDLLREIMSEARRLTNAERCSLFLLEPDGEHLVARVFDGISSKSEVRIARTQGIAGHVVTTGEILNIKNAYEHPLFYRRIDELTGFKTRNMLCFPIRDEDGIVGVAELCNKMGGSFDHFDEQMANAFSIYCGLSIVHSLVYREIRDAQARSKLSNELMMYHMKVSNEDIEKVLNCTNSHDFMEFNTFTFSAREINPNESLCYAVAMFEHLDFIRYFRIRKEMLIKFLMFVRKGYRDPPYHNWFHAMSVAHFAYLAIKNFRLIDDGYLNHLEAMAYLISCFCHDLDHRGTNNSFQQKSNSVLANLYSSEGSVMERHHLSQALCTLNSEGCNFLECLSRQEYTLCLDLMRDMILATDLATHFIIYKKQLAMAQTGYDRNNPEHKNAFLCLLMTCADLSDQTKSWLATRKVARLIYDEFFSQGDLEKKMGTNPTELMDRDKASIPDAQVEFLAKVCLPVFKVLAMMFPEARPLVDAIEANATRWNASKRVFEGLGREGRTSMEVLVGNELDVVEFEASP